MEAIWEEAIRRILARIDITANLGLDGYPHFANSVSGHWTTTPNGDWTGGFWVGELWLAYKYTGQSKYKLWAQKWLERLRPRVTSQTVFRGFLFYYGAAIADILFDDAEAREVGLQGARGLAALYNKRAGLIPLGAEAEEETKVGLGETNVDCVMAVALLNWASKILRDKKLAEIGINHARAHAPFCVRGDGSVCQSASFDPLTGKLLARYTHKGFSEDSTWARAQAWAMLGYSLASSSVPRDKQFLKTALQVSEWWMSHAPRDYVAFWDFDDSSTPKTERDTSATAIAASSLLKLSKLLPDSRGSRLSRYAKDTIETLVRGYLTPLREDERRPPGMLLSGCYNKKISLATNDELIWGDYFLFEALLDITGVLDGFIL